MIQRSDQAGATTAPPERTSRRERRESPAVPVISAPVRTGDTGTPDAMVVAPASTAAAPSMVTAAPAAMATPLPHHVVPEGPGFRAVFACVREPGGRSD